MKELFRYNLDYKKSIKYVRENLKDGNILSTELLLNLDFKKGHFFTLLPDNADLERIYDFFGGLILPQNRTHPQIDSYGKVNGYFTWIPTLRKEISHWIFEKLKQNESFICIFEDVQSALGDPHLEFFHEYGILYLNQIYYLLNNKISSPKVILSAISESDALWHLLFILADVESPNALDKEIDLYNIKEFCQKIKLLIVGAYDGEGFVLWEPTPMQ